MSDEENQQGGFPFHMIQLGPTPEQVEQSRMRGISNGHETIEFLESLTDTQLRHVQGLLMATVNSDGEAGNYYMGLVSGLLQFKRNCCIVCNQNHDEMLHEMAGQETAPTRECCESPVGMPHRLDCVLMVQYGMDINEDGDEKVMCMRCGTWYNSLEDRMLRKPGPEGCAGCVQKEKWG